MAINKIKTGSIQDNTVTGDDIQDGAITNAKVNACAAIAQSKVSGLTTSISNLCSSISSVSSAIGQQANNIGLLGFKMAVNDGLTVFNLVDGVVDEFNDESGTDESEGSNDLYNATDDYYINSSTPDGSPTPMASISAGFGLPTGLPYSCGSITEPDTSTIQRNSPTAGYTASPTGRVNIDQELFTFTVPTGMTNASVKLWGAGGGAGNGPATGHGGGGGFTTGNLAVTPGQVLHGLVGYGGGGNTAVSASPGTGVYANAPAVGNQVHLPGSGGHGGRGGGMSALFTADFDYLNKCGTFSQDGEATLVAGVCAARTDFSPFVPNVAFVAGAGGGSSRPSPTGTRVTGGAGGGLIGEAGGGNPAQTASGPDYSGGGSQTTGGQGGGPAPTRSESFVHFVPSEFCASGGSGFFAGGSGYYAGGGNTPIAGGGGSSYYGHPQVTCGSTTKGSACEGGGLSDPNYVASTNEGSTFNGSPGPTDQIGEQGYILITGTSVASATAQSTTIVSASFTSTTVPTTSRIVVFEENIDSPTLNTDIVASISRDGTNFTNATLSDSGYVTGSSGQRILTGQADISGQPSGQSMRWKLALANNQVKIHGVALQWS